MIYFTNSAEETEKLGALLAEKLDTGGHKNAFIAFNGEMGVGKTAFVRGFAAYFGIRNVKSPTYTVVNEYPARVPIYHFDMYRIESDDDLYSIGFDDYTAKDGYCIAEWSENIEDMLPRERICVRIERMQDGADKRKIEITAVGKYEDIGI